MRKIYLILICFVFIGSTTIFAQEKCGTSHKTQKKLQDPAIAQRVAEIEAFTQRWIQENQHLTQRSVVTIPVVVHVLYADATSNISEAQIQSQFPILNADFRKTNADFSNTPTAFQAVAADIEIEFCLANTDPSGNPTDGITRTSVPSNFDYENNYFNSSAGGVAPWDNTQYLNVWLGHLGNSGLLGFATPPGTAGQDDGVVIDHRAWGNTGTVVSPNHLGRTATHEIGHYLNLEHLWGPSNGGCNEDDFVNDTPLQHTESSGCETYPYFDNCTASGDGIMFMNYMDYSDDNCLVMFTQGQKLRMRAALDGPRVGLKTSIGCSQQTSTQNQLNIPVSVFPNPVESYLTISASSSDDLQIEIFNITGQSILSDKMPANQQQITISTVDLTAGMYFVKISTDDLFTTKKIIVKN